MLKSCRMRQKILSKADHLAFEEIHGRTFTNELQSSLINNLDKSHIEPMNGRDINQLHYPFYCRQFADSESLKVPIILTPITTL